MFVSYAYRSDDPSPQEDEDPRSRNAATKVVQETKTFSFHTVVDLGTIAAKED